MRIIFLFVSYFLCLTASAQTNYYVSPSGNDQHAGSINKPWKTTAAANTFDFEPGDQLHFAGGYSYGLLDLQESDEGLTVRSYSGIATLGGVYAYNAGNIKIINIHFNGPGVAGNELNGIFFFMDLASRDLDNITIDSVTVSNFGAQGILIGVDSTTHGFNNVQVLNSNLNNNGRGGFASYGFKDVYSHSNIYLYKLKTYQNYGRTDVTSIHTGSGIIVGGVDGALVEYCEAFENGKNNRGSAGGPQGIWCYNARNTIIQYSLSYNNKAGRLYDGGGFDIDGGSQNCIIQYCYSYGNEGPGFAMFEHGSTNQFSNNIIRYNISQNDARKNTHGALTFWSALSSNKIKNSSIYNNTIYVTPSAIGSPTALYFKGSNIANLNWANNIFYTTGSVKILRGTSPATNVYASNNYFTPDSIVNFKLGGTSVDPLFVQVGTGIEGYRLSIHSSMINSGVARPADKDFAGMPVPYNNGYDIGAYEYTATLLPLAIAGADQSIILPSNSILLNGSGTDGDGSIASFLWTKISGPSGAIITEANASSTSVSNLAEGTYHFRLTVTDNDGGVGVDDLQVVVAPMPLPPGSKYVKVNLFGGTNPYANTEWNNWNVSGSLNSGALKFSDANLSGISAALTKNTLSDNGATYGGTMAPPEVLRYTSNATILRTLTLSGLSPVKKYNLELYASRANTGNSTKFTLSGISMTVLTDNNKTRAASFNELAPTAEGKLVITIESINTYNYLNGFVLTELGDPPGVPIADAGQDQNIALPTTSITLNGSGADEDGSIVAYSWSKLSGPAATIDVPSSASTTVSSLLEGTYTFRLTVTDNAGLSSFDDVQVVVAPAPPPAGTKFVNVNLFGGTNPYNNGEWNNWNVNNSLTSGLLKYSDESVSGISAAISKNTISDNGATYGGTMTPPEVLRYTSNASVARTLTLSGLSATKTYNLELYASRANTGNSTTFTISGTAVTVLTDNNKTNKALFTNLSADVAGKLTVSLASVGTYNYLNGFILRENPPAPGTPTASAGADQGIVLPTTSTNLSGLGIDEDGFIASYSWTRLSGGAVNIDDPSSASTSISGLSEGTYTFRLTVTDNAGLSAFDDVQVVVAPAPPPPGTKYVKVNLFGGTNPYANSAWNNWNVNSSLSSGVLNYSDASTSTVSAVLTKNTLSDNGAAYGGTMAPPEVLRYTSNSSTARTLTFSGLSPSKSYNLELYASRANTGNSTTFTISGTAITVLTDNNKTNKASFTSLTSTAGGQLIVAIANVNAYNYLSGFTLTELGDGTLNFATHTSTSGQESLQLVVPEADKEGERLQGRVYPNPSPDVFSFRIVGGGKEGAVSLRVWDAAGRIMEQRTGLTSGSTVRTGEAWAPGIYLAELQQGTQKATLKLIKMDRGLQ